MRAKLVTGVSENQNGMRGPADSSASTLRAGQPPSLPTALLALRALRVSADNHVLRKRTFTVRRRQPANEADSPATRGPMPSANRSLRVDALLGRMLQRAAARRVPPRRAAVNAGATVVHSVEQSPHCSVRGVEPALTVDKTGPVRHSASVQSGNAPATDLTVSDFTPPPQASQCPLDSANAGAVLGEQPDPVGQRRSLPTPASTSKSATRIWQAGLSVADLQNGPTTLLQ
jgi:hypothetical protein